MTNNFKIGDIVKVINAGERYPFADELAKVMKLSCFKVDKESCFSRYYQDKLGEVIELEDNVVIENSLHRVGIRFTKDSKLIDQIFGCTGIKPVRRSRKCIDEIDSMLNN